MNRHTLVDDEDTRPEPARHSLLVLPNPLSEVVRRLGSYTDPSEGMDGDTSDVACSDT